MTDRLVRMKYLVEMNPSKSEIRGLPEETEASFIPMEAVGEGNGFDLTQSKPISQVRGGYTYFREGDLLVAKISPSFQNGKGGIVTGLKNGIGFGTTELHVLRACPETEPRWLYYIARSKPFIDELAAQMYGVAGQQRYSEEGLRNYVAWLPALDDQRAISAYLDRETARIDALIAQKERLLALLEEKRQALVSHAVTKGLDAKAPMKESDGFGPMPSHWRSMPLKHVKRPGTSITYGIVQAGPEVADGIPYIRTSDMKGEELPTEGYPKTSHEIDASYARSKVFAGDLVIAIRATVGKVLPLPAEISGANLTQGTAKFSPGPAVLRDFVLHALRSTPSLHRFELLGKGATFKEITLEMLRSFPIPVPPLAEQAAIVQHIGNHERRHGKLATNLSRSIALLRERRQSLITAAVTGQLDAGVCITQGGRA